MLPAGTARPGKPSLHSNGGPLVPAGHLVKPAKLRFCMCHLGCPLGRVCPGGYQATSRRPASVNITLSPSGATTIQPCSTAKLSTTTVLIPLDDHIDAAPPDL